LHAPGAVYANCLLQTNAWFLSLWSQAQSMPIVCSRLNVVSVTLEPGLSRQRCCASSYARLFANFAGSSSAMGSISAHPCSIAMHALGRNPPKPLIGAMLLSWLPFFNACNQCASLLFARAHPWQTRWKSSTQGPCLPVLPHQKVRLTPTRSQATHAEESSTGEASRLPRALRFLETRSQHA